MEATALNDAGMGRIIKELGEKAAARGDGEQGMKALTFYGRPDRGISGEERWRRGLRPEVQRWRPALIPTMAAAGGVRQGAIVTKGDFPQDTFGKEEVGDQLADNIRLVAAASLAANANPAARAMLIELRNDAYYGVRLTIDSVIFKKSNHLPQEQAVAWRAMTHDVNAVVAGEARRLLDETGARTQ